MNISPRQLGILRHALGLDRKGTTVNTSYRDHYVPSGDDTVECETLEKLGLMRIGLMRKRSVGWIPDPFYQVTLDGKDFMRKMENSE